MQHRARLVTAMIGNNGRTVPLEEPQQLSLRTARKKRLPRLFDKTANAIRDFNKGGWQQTASYGVQEANVFIQRERLEDAESFTKTVKFAVQGWPVLIWTEVHIIQEQCGEERVEGIGGDIRR